MTENRNDIYLLPYRTAVVRSKRISSGTIMGVIWHQYHFGLVAAKVHNDIITDVFLMSSLKSYFDSDPSILDRFLSSLSNVGYPRFHKKVKFVEFDQDEESKEGDSNNLCGIYTLMFCRNLLLNKPLNKVMAVNLSEVARTQIYHQIKAKIAVSKSFDLLSPFSNQSKYIEIQSRFVGLPPSLDMTLENCIKPSGDKDNAHIEEQLQPSCSEVKKISLHSDLKPAIKLQHNQDQPNQVKIREIASFGYDAVAKKDLNNQVWLNSTVFVSLNL